MQKNSVMETSASAEAKPDLKLVKEWDGQAIPMSKWGKDHWSTLLYIEVRCVDHRGLPEADHMRSEPGRPRRGHFKRGADGEERMRPAAVTNCRYATRLNDGTKIFGHDDWSCASDIEDAGLLLWEGTGMQPVFKLTDLGWQIAGKLRRWRAEGNTSATFVAAPYLGKAEP